MSNLANAQIINLLEERCLNPENFGEFSTQLQDLLVVRQTYDVVTDELFFYSSDQLLLQIYAHDVKGYIWDQPFVVAEKYNQQLLEKALEDFDSKKITVGEFHKQLAAAGIVYVSVHLPSRKIYYLSQDGQFYLEAY